MPVVNLATAKARLSELVDLALKGESVGITRRGKLVARLSAVDAPLRPIDVQALEALTESGPEQAESAGDFVRLRDEARY